MWQDELWNKGSLLTESLRLLWEDMNTLMLTEVLNFIIEALTIKRFCAKEFSNNPEILTKTDMLDYLGKN